LLAFLLLLASLEFQVFSLLLLLAFLLFLASLVLLGFLLLLFPLL
jgi:hypothetical protein